MGLAGKLRGIVRNAVLSDTEAYPEAVLGLYGGVAIELRRFIYNFLFFSCLLCRLLHSSDGLIFRASLLFSTDHLLYRMNSSCELLIDFLW